MSEVLPSRAGVFTSSETAETEPTDIFTLHPVVYTFPELSEKEFSKLVDSIQANGQLDPIWATRANEVFDGRHRLRACQKLNIPVLVRRTDSVKAETLSAVLDLVIAQNLSRRHMTKHQRAVVAASLESKRVAAIAQQEQGNLSLDGGDSFSWNSIDELLSDFRVTKEMYKLADQLRRNAEPEVVSLVEAGTIDIHAGLCNARARTKLTREEVLSCVDSPDPGAALQKTYFEKSTWEREEAIRKFEQEQGWTPTTRGQDLLSDALCSIYQLPVDVDMSLFEPLSLEEMEDCSEDVNKSVTYICKLKERFDELLAEQTAKEKEVAV